MASLMGHGLKVRWPAPTLSEICLLPPLLLKRLHETLEAFDAVGKRRGWGSFG
jgi:hypothetical protein